ncbi:MAG TPA: hypothetical protein VK013_14050 [Myxococcaceae bacterium]|nr:hypothetical protein [Myxococcaceae bacterium]
MTGLRVFLLCMTAFALLCVAGFHVLERADAEPEPPPRRPRIQTAAAHPSPAPVAAPIIPPRVQAPALPTRVSVREPTEPLPEPLPEITTTVTDSRSEPGDDKDEEEVSEGTLTEAPLQWVTATTQELTRLFTDCRRVEGASVEGPVYIDVELVFEPNILDGPAERVAFPSVDDPYLAACLSDSLWDAELPDLGAPGDFQHRMTFQLDP